MSDIFILDDDKEDKKGGNINNTKIVDNRNMMDKINDYLLEGQSLQTKDKLIFYRLLSTMINAGITLTKGIFILEKQEKNPVLKKILARFMIELREGKAFSECLEMYPNSFGRAEVGIIESGEKTGKLNTALVDLADQVEKIESISGKIKGAMMYPIMILIVVFGVIGVMMTMVVPKLLEIFDSSASLPASTQLLIAISDFFINYWWLMLGFIGFTIAFVSVWKKTPSGMYLYDKFILKIPIFGDISKKLVLSKFARTLSGLLGSGVSIVESLRITSEAVGNEVFRQRIILLQEDIKQGLKMYESLEGDTLFPDMLIQMVEVGEQTAKLDSIIIKIADFYDEQVDGTVAVISKLLEPIIIVFMAVVVGFIAVAIMQPIMNLADVVSEG